MKAIIESVEFTKEFESKFGTLYSFRIGYNGKKAFYSSKKKDQTKFIKGQEAEFTEELMKTEKGEFWKIKPLASNSFGGYNKAIKKEQSRYSGFAVSYVKDLIVAGKLEMKQWKPASKDIFEFMVALDKTLES